MLIVDVIENFIVPFYNTDHYNPDRKSFVYRSESVSKFKLPVIVWNRNYLNIENKAFV